MLSYFSSLKYLMELHERVTNLVNGVVDPVLDQARSQNRDATLSNARWGTRDTSQNWANYGWPFLKDLQASLAKNIARRASGNYSMTAVNEYLRGVEQFSLQWMTPGEERIFKVGIQGINDHASPLDLTMADQMTSDWNDYRFAYRYPAFASRFNEIPRYRIRTDIVYPSGVVPEETGIYISKDDPHATLQFAWSGKEGRKLRNAITFNDLGIAALAAVGRDDLWFNSQKMFDFATAAQFAQILRDDVIWDDGPHPDLAPSAIARRAFMTRASGWCLVEPIEGEFDRLADLGAATPIEQGSRIVGGEKCIEPGFYFSPSQPNSRRYLTRGEITPTFDSQYGETFWQWDANQK
jgi:hypothetical protein